MNTRHIHIISLFFLLLLTASCNEELGNYDYVDINEIEINNIEPGYSYSYMRDSFNIEPQLTLSLDNNSADRYTYRWEAYRTNVGIVDNDNLKPIPLGSTLKLHKKVELVPGGYLLYFRILDKQTGVEWAKTTSVTVSTPLTKGFLLSGTNRQGNAEVDMISMSTDTVAVRALLANTEFNDLKGPISIMHTGVTTLTKTIKVWLMTQDGSYHLNTSTLQGTKSNTFEKMFFTSFNVPENIHPVEIAPKVNGPAGGTARGYNNRIVITNDGSCFIASLFEGDFYSDPVNRTNDKPDVLFQAYPYVMHGAQRFTNFILYNKTDSCFTHASTLDATMSELADQETDAFPWKQSNTKRDLVYAENSRDMEGGGEGNTFTLMKDNAGKAYIYKFNVARRLKVGFYEIKDTAPDVLADNALYAFSSMRTVMLYAVGSKLYAYDYNKGQERVQLIRDFGDEITMLKFDLQAISTPYNDVYVATYNPVTGGALSKFVLGSNPDKLEMEPDEKMHFEDLIRIKSMEFRNSIN